MKLLRRNTLLALTVHQLLWGWPAVSILFQRYQAPAKNDIVSGSAFKIKLRCSSVTSGLKFAPNTKMVNKANLDISQSATAVENTVNFEALTP